MAQSILVLLIIALLTVGTDPLRKHFPEQQAERLLWTAFILYVLGNMYFTLLSRIPESGTHFDPRPFGTYLRKSEVIDADFQNTTGFAAFFLKDITSLTGVILNILLYYPMGYLLSILFPRLNSWQIVLIGCAASVTTELAQYLLKMGWCEMDDILCNTLGTAIGMMLRRRQDRRILMRK